jgi:hypothetical protein
VGEDAALVQRIALRQLLPQLTPYAEDVLHVEHRLTCTHAHAHIETERLVKGTAAREHCYWVCACRVVLMVPQRWMKPHRMSEWVLVQPKGPRSVCSWDSN